MQLPPGLTLNLPVNRSRSKHEYFATTERLKFFAVTQTQTLRRWKYSEERDNRMSTDCASWSPSRFENVDCLKFKNSSDHLFGIHQAFYLRMTFPRRRWMETGRSKTTPDRTLVPNTRKHSCLSANLHRANSLIALSAPGIQCHRSLGLSAVGAVLDCAEFFRDHWQQEVNAISRFHSGIVECRMSGPATLYGSLAAMRPDSSSGFHWPFTCLR